MNLKLVGMLALFGVVVGVATTMGWVGALETALWVVFGVVGAILIARQAPGRFFLHGFFAGFLASAIALVIQAVMFPTYLENNPNAAVAFAQLPSSMDPQIVVLVIAPFVACFGGLVLGVLAMVAGKLLRSGRTSSAPTT